MTLFRTLFAIDIVIAVVVLFFFATGLNDGSVSEFNISLWFGVIAAIGAIIGTGYAFNVRGQQGLACAVLGILVAPGLLYALFILVVVVGQPDWR